MPPARIERTTPGLGILASTSSDRNFAAVCGENRRHGECIADEDRSVPHLSAAQLWANCGLDLVAAIPPATCAPASGSPLSLVGALPLLLILPGCLGDGPVTTPGESVIGFFVVVGILWASMAFWGSLIALHAWITGRGASHVAPPVVGPNSTGGRASTVQPCLDCDGMGMVPRILDTAGDSDFHPCASCSGTGWHTPRLVRSSCGMHPEWW